VVPTLDDYSDRDFVGGRELASVASPVAHHPSGNFNCGVVDLFSDFGASDAAADGGRTAAGKILKLLSNSSIFHFWSKL
jgi:hypothetical protein